MHLKLPKDTDSVVEVIAIKSGGDCQMLFSNIHIYKTYGLIYTYTQTPLYSLGSGWFQMALVRYTGNIKHR